VHNWDILRQLLVRCFDQMALNIFICYKKLLTNQLEGGVIEQRDSKANLLHALLTQDTQYSPWIDEAALGAGMAWETEIYSRILLSDVLLVVIEHGTSQSQWVQREIALANALGISIFPLASDLSGDEMLHELKALQIDQLQGRITHNLKWNSKDALLTELRRDLLSAAERTKKQQEHALKGLLSRRLMQQPKAQDNKSAANFRFKNGHSGTLHVASGDISRIRGVDVFVNSENDYMQMARVFESKTISATLRRMGSRIRDGRYEDTVQQELDVQLAKRGRPVQYGEVFATSAGGPTSILAKENKARYIFHVAAVQAIPAEARLAPFKQSFQIETCVRSVMTKIVSVKEANGMISPDGTEQLFEQERRSAAGEAVIRSVVLPLFGTGQGGASVSEVLGPMIEGLVGTLDEEKTALSDLSDIYLSAYTLSDVDEVTSFLRSHSALEEM
jgi:O-acetyl-ADP-ribose deacetylase (regulator of RNase III)